MPPSSLLLTGHDLVHPGAKMVVDDTVADKRACLVAERDKKVLDDIHYK